MASKKFVSKEALQYAITKLKLLLAGKVDKVDGKGLSSNDYTAEEKAKLATIEQGAEVNVNADWNAVTGDSAILNKPDVVEQTEFDALSDRVDDIIAEGGEPNVIEVVKKNGVPLVPDSNKAVDVEVPTKVSDLTNDGDGTAGSQFATKSYVDQNGGKIDKIKVNGTEQTITNKEVDIAMPTDLDDLTNNGSDPFVQKSDLDSALVGALKPKGSIAFASLPALTAANLNSMYNITDSFTTTADFVEGAGKEYPAGTEVAIINTGTDASPVFKYSAMVGIIDMSAYWNTSNLIPVTTAEIDEMFE